MKKTLLFAMGALLAMPAFAQEEDVTHYIQNAGFDEDLTWQADGSMKEAAETKTLSDRSIAAIAADGSLYATVNPSTPKKRNDGRTFEATNGFVGMMKGWEWVNLTDDSKPNERIESKACEWVYFGAVSYDLGETTVPIADDGTQYLTVPARSDQFESGAAALYLRAGWGNQFAYKQVVKLPCAKYRLEYWTINVNPNTTATATDLSKITCRKETFQEEGGAALTAADWTQHSFEFTPTSEFTIQFGFKAGNGGSGATPWVYIDGIKLVKVGEADPLELLQSDISDLQTKCDALSAQADFLGYSGLAGIIGDYGMTTLDEMRSESDQATLEAALKDAEAQIAKFEEAVNAMSSINTMLSKIETLLTNTNYPGKDALQAAQTTINGYKDYFEEDAVEKILGAVDEANAAIRAYYLSQEASVNNPADYTFFIQNPWFIIPEAEPVLDADTYIFPKQFDEETGEERYKQGSTNADLTSEGWYIAGRTGGDQRLNWQQNRSCWNAWSSGFSDVIAVAQDLENMPNGYYTVSADLITQSGCVTDQHVFVKSVAGKNISASLSTEGWSDDGYGQWETLAMTAEQKVLVIDGKLTIGAEGTGSGSGSAGWFLATNFKLQYLGEASQEDVEQAYTALYEKADAMAGEMHFKADIKALKDTLNNYTRVSDYTAAFTAVSTAMTEAQKSIDKYNEYIPADGTTEGKTLPTVASTLKRNGGEGYDYAEDIVAFAYDYVQTWIACDTASYVDFDATVDLLKNYLNTYTPAYNAAAEVAVKASEKGKAALEALMAKQKTALTTEMQNKETVDAYVSELNSLSAIVEKQNIYDNPDTKDYTAFIQNPKLEAETGWEFTKGNGNNNTGGGQWYDGTSTRYIDSYNGGGLKGYIATQLVTDLPNGTYNLGVYARTPGEGAYIIYAPQADTTFVEIPLHYYQTVTDEGNDTTVVASDTHGPIWEEAEAAVTAGTYTEEQWNIYNANNGAGRGWKHIDIEGIVVTDHKLLIGAMAGTEESQTPKVFDGAWFSAGGWTLTLVSMGNNDGWGGPIENGISTVTANTTVADGIYTLTGVKTSGLQHGLNIIVNNGRARKVMVK